METQAGWMLPDHVSLPVQVINADTLSLLRAAQTIGRAQSVPAIGMAFHPESGQID
jgi:hypothetical protein